MNVIVLRETCQEFDGKKYFLCDKYFQRDGIRLHRVVWEYHNKQSIPDGMAIHHRDKDRHNNDISNLILIDKSGHTKLHSGLLSEEQKKKRQEHARNVMVPKAAEWHRSEKSKWLYQKLGPILKEYWKNRQPHIKKVCVWCGTEYMAYFERTMYCGKKCKTKSSDTARILRKKHQSL